MITNERQRIAMMHPCARAPEIQNPWFRDIEGNWSTILTINK